MRMHTTCETSIRAAAALMIYLLKYSSKGQAWQDAQAPALCAALQAQAAGRPERFFTGSVPRKGALPFCVLKKEAMQGKRDLIEQGTSKTGAHLLGAGKVPPAARGAV